MIFNSLQKEFDKNFGNYLLHGMEEVYLPDAILWLPTALGWKIISVLAFLWLCRLAFRRFILWKKNHYRRMALKELDLMQTHGADPGYVLKQLPKILKSTALKAYPRADIASVTGQAWLKLLDNTCGNRMFTTPAGELLLKITYQPEQNWNLSAEQVQNLIRITRQWIRHHQANSKELS